MGDIAFNDNLRSDRGQQIIDDLDKGVSPGYIELYGGGSGRPAKGVAITDQTLIGTLTLSDPSGTVSNGVVTFNIIADDTSADADADIEWARWYDGDDTFVFDCGCSLDSAAPQDLKTLQFNTLTARIGGVIQILSGSMTEGNL